MSVARRVVLLARVSTTDKGQEPENQLGPLRAIVARHGWSVADEIALKQSAWDESSAAEVKRKALAPIVEGRADILAVWALDRLVRGGIEAAFSFLRELEGHHGAEFFSLQEPFLSTASADRQTRELMISLLSWIAKWESQRKSERLKASAQTKRARVGSLEGRRAVWGPGHLASASEIAAARELRAGGASLRAIASRLWLSKSAGGRLLAG
jgi:DNA invertase Pin-like site-specific DNA recombinase